MSNWEEKKGELISKFSGSIDGLKDIADEAYRAGLKDAVERLLEKPFVLDDEADCGDYSNAIEERKQELLSSDDTNE